MKPVDPPAPAPQVQAQHKFHVIPSLPPKRRSKTQLETTTPPPEIPPAPMPFQPSGHRPERITRSGQPFQVWKAPTSDRAPLQPDAPRPDVSQTPRGFWELARSYGRTLVLLFSGRGLRPSP